MNKQMIRKLLAVAICVCATGCSSNTSSAQPGLIEEGKENDLISEEEAKKVALNQYGKTAFVSEISLDGYIYTAKVIEERYIYTIQIDARTKMILSIETSIQSS